MKQIIIISIFLFFSIFSASAQDKNSNENYILKNGFFLDGLIQGGGSEQGSVSQTTIQPNLSLGLRFGSKWFFGEGNVYRPGIVVNWMRNDFILTSNNTASSSNSISSTFAIDPLNIGFSNVICFNEKMGLELDITGGLSALIGGNIFSIDTKLAGVFGATVKFRYKKMSIGIDFCHRQVVNPTSYTYQDSNQVEAFNSIGLSIGGTF